MDTNSLELQFESQNKIVTMNKKSSEIKIISIEGIETSDYTFSKIASNQHGTNITSRKIEPREITITGEVLKNDNEDLNRENMISFFSPLYDGELRIKRNKLERKIGYTTSSLKFTNKNMYEILQFKLVLECANPFFEDIDNFGNDIASITKQFAFPLGIVLPKGKIMGFKTFTDNVKLVNNGDIETGLEIQIKAIKGSVTNPKITLNDEFIEVITTMQENDILKINTNEKKKSIMLDDQNVIQKINKKSTFFSLPIGTNYIKYESKEGYLNMEVRVYFYKKYLGI